MDKALAWLKGNDPDFDLADYRLERGLEVPFEELREEGQDYMAVVEDWIYFSQLETDGQPAEPEAVPEWLYDFRIGDRVEPSVFGPAAISVRRMGF